MQTLADFKRELAKPNALFELIKRELKRPDSEWEETPIALPLQGPRSVAKLQTNAVAFTTPNNSGKSWLWFGTAASWEFVNDLAITTDINGDYGLRLTYKLITDQN